MILLTNYYIQIYDSITTKLLKKYGISYKLIYESISNFVLSEIFVRKMFYYQPSNLIVIIYYMMMMCFNANTLEIVYNYKVSFTNHAFKSIVIDMDLGYIISTHQDKDCIFNMMTLERNCYKEFDSFKGFPMTALPEYALQLFINQSTKTIIICQAISIRLFSLSDLKYVGSIYDTGLDAAQFFYNPYFNYIIFSSKSDLIFSCLDLSNMFKKQIILPSPSKDAQSINYRIGLVYFFQAQFIYYIQLLQFINIIQFHFLSDKQDYLFVNSNFLFVQIYDQQTHILKSSISLDQAFYQYSNWIVDEKRKYLFMMDTGSALLHYSYDSKKLIYKYKFNQLGTLNFYNDMIWDTYKQKLILHSTIYLFVIGISKNIIEFQYKVDFNIIQIQLIPNKNILSICSYQSCTTMHYDYMIIDNKDIFPNQLNPRFYKVNNDIIFHLNDRNSIATLFVKKLIKDMWIKNYLNFGNIRIIDNDKQQLLVYAIFDNEISVLDLSNSQIVLIDQVFLQYNIIAIIYENNDHIFLLSQSQQILTLNKRQNNIIINEAIVLPQGLAQYLFLQNATQFVFTDFSTNQTLKIVNFTQEQNIIKGKLIISIQMVSRIVNFASLTDTELVILLENKLILYSIQSQSITKTISLLTFHRYSNVKVDNINQRIFVQNQYYGSMVYDYNLNQKAQTQQINTFSNDISFDQYFIYSLNGHSANLYFRKDLKFLINFRNFDMSFYLKKITYLGIGYLFFVEFLTKLSIYELSPFIKEPIEKDFVIINQFTVIDFKLLKIQNNKYHNLYQVDVTGITQEGMFIYTLEFDIYNQEYSKLCTWSFPFQQEFYQETQYINLMTQQLSGQSRKLDRITITIQSEQILRLPIIPIHITSDRFGISLTGISGDENLYIQLPLNHINFIQFLKFKKMNITPYPLSYNEYFTSNKIPISIEINSQNFPGLQQLILKDINLKEVTINVKNINQVTIKNLILSSIPKGASIKSLTSIKIISADNVLITQLIIDKSEFYLSNPLLALINIKKVIINKILISKSSFYCLNAIFYFNNIDQIEVNELIITQNTFNESQILFFNLIKLIEIHQFIIQNNKYDSQSKRILQVSDTNSIDKKLFYFLDIQTIQVRLLQIGQFSTSSNFKILIFSIKYVKVLLSIQQSQITNIQINQQQNGIIFALDGVYNVEINSLNSHNISFASLIKQQSYQLTPYNSTSCYKISILQSNITDYEISYESVIDIQSFVTQIDGIIFKNIRLNLFQQQLSIPSIKIKSNKKLTISNSKFSDIKQLKDSMLFVFDSKNVLIEDNQFQNIYSISSGSVSKFESTEVININSNTFSFNSAEQDGGVVFFKKSYSISIKKNKFNNNLSLKGQGGSIYSIESKFTIIESNSFDANQSLNGSGGAFYSQQCNFQLINNNQFIQNLAQNGNGGALFLYNCDILQFNGNYFKLNSAFIGGAIRYKILKPQILMNNQLIQIKKQNQFIKNKCISYGKDFGSYPLILDVKNSIEDDNLLNNATIDNVQSGYKANKTIYLRFIDEEMNEINIVQFEQYPSVINEIKEEISNLILQAESDKIGVEGDLKQSYTYDAYAFVFDFSYSFHPKDQAYIKIKSTQLLPQFLPGTQQMVLKQYEVQIQINFRECQTGEIILKRDSYTICSTCTQGFYSILNPYSRDDISCHKCPIGSIDCYGKNIILQNGYWRSGEDSDKVEYCSNKPFNCQPQNNNTRFGCLEGYIGPLCEECDTHGKIWGRRFSEKSEFSCMDCQQFSSAANIIIFIVIFLFILLQISHKAYKQGVAAKKCIQALYLSKLGLISPKIEKTQILSSSYMKILLNYFQFMMTVNSLDIQLPIYFSFFNVSGGDTSKNTINRIDCLLFKYKYEFPNYVIRVLWINLQPICMLMFLEIISLLTSKNNQISAQRQTIYTNLIIIFSFYQPSIVKVLSQSFSCRKIGDEEYIQSDLNQKCLNDEHLKYFYQILLPLSIFWIFFCPLLLLDRVRCNKNRMNKIQIIYRYGYLYQHYYWDILRMFIRSSAIVTLNVFNFNVLFKGFVIMGLIYFYMVLSMKIKPYIFHKFNSLDKESCLLVILTLYFLFLGYFSQSTVLSLFITTLIAILNGKFIIKMLGMILIKPVSPYKNERNKLQECMFRLKQKFPTLIFCIQIEKKSRKEAFRNWKKLYKQFIQIKQLTKKIKSNNDQLLKQTSQKNEIFITQDSYETTNLLNSQRNQQYESTDYILNT